jgi:hypothetical protein
MPLINVPAMLVQMPGGDYKEFPLIKNCYFKAQFGGPSYISGLSLPDPKGDYYFQDCVFHPGLYDELDKNYKGSIFVNCER